MNPPTFFTFGSKLVSANVQVSAVGLKTDENGIDDHWKLIKGNYKDINFPVIFKQEYGKNLTDILGTGWPGLYLISDKMKTVLEGNHLTGWKVFPIKLFDLKGNEIVGYHGFSVTGRCESTGFEHSEIIEKQFIATGPICKCYKGISIYQWDGSDFFCSEKKYKTFISQKASNLLKKNKITNLRLENTSECEVDIRHVNKNKSV